MEKISRIVRGNSRVASVDLKNSAPVRPGAPGFGRPTGESTAVNNKALSTADRAIAIHKEMNERKMANTEQTVVQNLADKFFMERMRRPQLEDVVAPGMGQVPSAEMAAPVEAAPSEDDAEVSEPVDSVTPPEQRYTPRGSYIDVRA